MPGFWPCCRTPTGTSESAAVNVILLEPIGNLGSLGDEVSVKRGFARNYLLPQGKAVPATEENRHAFEARRAELEQAASERRAAAQDRGQRLQEVELAIAARAAEEGRLYGSVGAREIAAALTAQGIEVHRSEVRLPDGVIRNIGDYQVAVQLHSDLTITIPISVIAE